MARPQTSQVGKSAHIRHSHGTVRAVASTAGGGRISPHPGWGRAREFKAVRRQQRLAALGQYTRSPDDGGGDGRTNDADRRRDLTGGAQVTRAEATDADQDDAGHRRRTTRTPTTRTPTDSDADDADDQRQLAAERASRAASSRSGRRVLRGVLGAAAARRRRATSRGRFDDLLSVGGRRAARLLGRPARTRPSASSRRAGEPVGATTRRTSPGVRDPFTGTADVRPRLAEFDAGATIVLQALHHHLARRSRVLPRARARARPSRAGERLLHAARARRACPCTTTRTTSSSCRSSGEKRWLVYEPALELPLSTSATRTELGEPGPTVLDVRCAPGDTLYLPRGWLHEALTSEHDSLHLTVGVNVVHLDRRAASAALEACGGRARASAGRSRHGEQRRAARARSPAASSARDVVRRRRERLVAARRPLLADGSRSCARSTR